MHELSHPSEILMHAGCLLPFAISPCGNAEVIRGNFPDGWSGLLIASSGSALSSPFGISMLPKALVQESVFDFARIPCFPSFDCTDPQELNHRLHF